MSFNRGRHARPSMMVRWLRWVAAWNRAETRRLELEATAREVREARLRRSLP